MSEKEVEVVKSVERPVNELKLRRIIAVGQATYTVKAGFY